MGEGIYLSLGDNEQTDKMEKSPVLRLVGLALIVVGVTLVSNPELVVNKPIPVDAYQATERRIWWGLIIGFGLLLMFHHQLLPWKPTIAATFLAILLGLLAARLIGVVLDGSLAEQLVNLGIEVVMLVLLVWWYLRVRK